MKVLIVEDEAIVALSLKLELETKGYDVCGFVSSGEEAVELAGTSFPDLILMDINLAGEQDGISAAEEILIHGSPRIIFFSGHSRLAMDPRLQKLKPLGLLSKPVTVTMIEALLTSEED
jgi:DNA-binding NarL/FixJ family response regulator